MKNRPKIGIFGLSGPNTGCERPLRSAINLAPGRDFSQKRCRWMRKHDIKGGHTDYFCIKTRQEASTIDFSPGSAKKPDFRPFFGIFWTSTRRPKKNWNNSG